MRVGRRLRLGAGALAIALLAAACNGLTVDQRGVYTSSSPTAITGTVTVGEGDSLASVTVNGVPATVDGEQFSADIPLDGAAIQNAVLVEATYGSGAVIRERRTVVYGDGHTAQVLPAGSVIGDAVGLRINDRSFTKLGPVVKSLTTIDTASIAPPGTVFLDECITQVFVCTLSAKATSAAAPSIRDFSVALDSNQGNVRAVVTLSGMHVPVNVAARIAGIPANCSMNVDAASIAIDGNYTLRPSPTDPHVLDVNLVGRSPTVTLSGVTHDFVGGICSIPGIEQIVDLFLPDVQDMMQTKLTALLGDPDGAGPADSPVADAVEAALAKLTIAGDIGGALGLTLDSTLQTASPDPDGIGIGATAAFTASAVAPGAPDLPGSVAYPGDKLGTLPTTTPGGRPFDVAVGASASSFNQLLAGETERGLLNVDVTSLGGRPLTLKGLYDLIGAGSLVTQDHPLAISLRPEVAPIVTTGPGPNGALGELRLSGYRATIRNTDDNSVFLELVLDFRTGVGMVLKDGGLAFTFAPPAPGDLAATVTQNPNNLPDALVQQVFQQLSPQVFASVQDVLPSFPLPQFAGLDLSLVELSRVGSGFVLFADLTPAG
jgi:hypothetical protein